MYLQLRGPATTCTLLKLGLFIKGPNIHVCIAWGSDLSKTK